MGFNAIYAMTNWTVLYQVAEIMNKKGFGRKQPWLNQSALLEFA
jgi:hypothetical protein